MTDPINAIEWRDAASLLQNNYNPNAVFAPELKLLERSILLTGYVQPILITTDGTVIDGFHRVRLALESAALKKRYGGKVPCAVIDVPRDAAMVLTIRMNRAKGSHVAFRMSEIVRELIDTFHYDSQQICVEIGATKDEVDLLYQDGVFSKKKIADYRYSKAWYPAVGNKERNAV